MPVPVSIHSAKGIIDEYRNRWCIEVFFKEEKSYWYLNIVNHSNFTRKYCAAAFNNSGKYVLTDYIRYGMQECSILLHN